MKRNPAEVRKEKWNAYRQELKEKRNAYSPEETGTRDILHLLRLYFALGSEYRAYFDEGKAFLQKIEKTEDKEPEQISAYRSAFKGLEAKYKSWPLEKYNLVNDALDELSAFIDEAPRDLDLRFLRMALGAKIPGLFKKNAQLREDVKSVKELLETERDAFAASFIEYVEDFLRENDL